MQNLSEHLRTSFEGNVTTLAFCCKITQRRGEVLAFTSFDKSLEIEGVVFEPSNGFQHTALDQRVDLSPGSIDIQAIIDDDRITEEALLNGEFDSAVVKNFMVDYTDLEAGSMTLATGLIRNIRIQDDLFVAEIDGLSSQLKQAHLDLYSPTCRVKRLGNARCGVDIAPFTFDYTVDSIESEYSFTIQESGQHDDYFRFGIIEWVSGENAGAESVVKRYVDDTFTLLEPLLRPIQPGDRFEATRGCDRQFGTCRDVFDNVQNFRGEPPHLLPGIDKIRSPLGN